jgi:hypothetical protein
VGGLDYYLLPVAWLLAFGVGAVTAVGLRPRGRAPSRILVAAAVIPLLLFARNYRCLDLGTMSLEYDYGRDLIDSSLPGSVIFISGDDIIAPVMYLRAVERHRPDLKIIPRGFLTHPPFRARIRALVPELAPLLASPKSARTEAAESREAVSLFLRHGRPCYLTSAGRPGIHAGLRREFRDSAFRILPPGQSPVPTIRPPTVRTRGWFHHPAALTERQRLLIHISGEHLARYAGALVKNGHVAGALPRFRLAMTNPFLPRKGEIAFNFATALLERGRRRDARAAFQKTLSLAPAGSHLAALATKQLERL